MSDGSVDATGGRQDGACDADDEGKSRESRVQSLAVDES